jgi:nitrite reductase/ring-hydroxylating ferredoxin subunit
MHIGADIRCDTRDSARWTKFSASATPANMHATANRRLGDMGILKRIFGICETDRPADAECWTYSDGKVEIVLERAQELEKPGGAIRLEGGGLPIRVLVVHGDDNQFHAFPNRCTHMGGRRLDPVPGESTIRCCSVGKSTFDYEGTRLSGSAKRTLEPLAVEVDGGKLVVRISRNR